MPEAQYLQSCTFYHMRCEYKLYMILQTNSKANKAEKKDLIVYYSRFSGSTVYSVLALRLAVLQPSLGTGQLSSH